MQNAQLNKQWWTTQKKSKRGELTQTKRSCKSSLGSSLRKKERNYRTDRFTEVWQKKRDCYSFFSSVFSPAFAKSVLNIKVSIYTGAEYTGQQGQKKMENKGQKMTLRQVLLVRNDVKILLLCCCCSNNTISTTFLPVPQIHQDKVSAVAEAKLISPVTLTACLQYFSLLMEKRHRRCFSSSTQKKCSHCEQHRHQVHSLPTDGEQ